VGIAGDGRRHRSAAVEEGAERDRRLLPKAKAAAGEAEQMLAHAREEADAILAQARADAAALIERRGRMAEDKIAAAERTAVAEVRARAANAAAAAAAQLIAEKHDAQSDKPLVDSAIDGLGNVRLS
jgi:F-type H+-transporting ATPase subunit b